jgi:biotin transport system substrate-specific component
MPTSSSTTARTAALPTVELAYVALFAALIGVLGLVPAINTGVISVPITLQTAGVMLAGAVLGPRRGALAVALFLLVVAAGAPLLAGGRGGIGAFTGPSGGFLLGFVPGAYAVGLIAMRAPREGRRAVAGLLLACVVGGIAVVYAFGIPFLAAVTDTTLGEAATGSATFLPGDAVKAVVAALVAERLRALRVLDA